jgi:4a-hydroxytetrahydrobiopterin dehydratase
MSFTTCMIFTIIEGPMKLAASDVEARLKDSAWKVQGDGLVRTFTFASFADAIAFVTRLAFNAEAADHHPDLHVSYRKVTVTWSTHSEGGITDKDFEGTRQSDAIADRLGFKA